MTPRNLRKLHLVQLAAAVDIAAQLLAQNIFQWKSPRYERDAPNQYRRRLLSRLVQNLLAQIILDFSLDGIRRDEAKLEAALSALAEGRDVPDVPESAPPLGETEMRRALPHLERAVVRRVVQERSRDSEGRRAGAWMNDFREACLRMQPRLIPPSMTVETLAQELRRLRAKAKLPAAAVRRSRRSIGLARLRSWGLITGGS